MSTTKQVTLEFNFRTKDNYKRPSLSLDMAVPTAQGIANLLNHSNPKVVELVVDSITEVLRGHVRNFVDQDLDFSQATLDALIAEGKIGIEAIANMPKSERNVLTKDELEAFAKDYIAIMPGITGKTEKQVSMAAGLFVERYKRVAGDAPVLQVLADQLATFIDGAPEEVVAQHVRPLEYLSNKVAELIEASQQVTADAL